MRYITTLAFIIISSVLIAKPTHVVTDPHAHMTTSNRGFFSVMDHVFEGVHKYLYDRHLHKKYCGLTVDFQQRGMYYDPSKGDNWWHYYFETMKVGDVTPKRSYKQFDSPEFYERVYSKESTHELIMQFLTIKMEIIHELDRLQAELFQECYVIGVHYRGTDHAAEAPPVPYETVAEVVRTRLQSITVDCRIFVATDEQSFIDFMERSFPGRVVYVLECQRSLDGKPLHYYSEHPYESGLYALIDCLMLSRCHEMVRTQSNLSRWTTYFNPSMPVLMLNQRW